MIRITCPGWTLLIAARGSRHQRQKVFEHIARGAQHNNADCVHVPQPLGRHPWRRIRDVTKATEVLASLDGPADPGADAAWTLEIERRVAAIEAGTVKLEPWEDVKRRIKKEILGR